MIKTLCQYWFGLNKTEIFRLVCHEIPAHKGAGCKMQNGSHFLHEKSFVAEIPADPILQHCVITI